MESVVAALEMSFCPSTREVQQATLYLEQAADQSGFCCNLMSIVDNAALDSRVRTAAAVALKNTVKRNMQATTPVREQELKFTRANLTEGLQRVIRSELAPIYLEVLLLLLPRDVMTQWPGLLSQVNLKLAGPELGSIQTGLAMLQAMFKKRQFDVGKQRQSLQSLAATYLPQCLRMVQAILGSFTAGNEVFVHLALKVFWRAVRQQMPAVLLTSGQLAEWMTVFRVIIQAPCEQKEAPFNRLKKWAYKITYHILQHYCDQRLASKKMVEQAQQWKQLYLNNLLAASIQNLRASHNLPEKVLILALKHVLLYLGGSHVPLLVTQLDSLVFGKLLELVVLRPEDAQIADELEWLRRDQDLDASRVRTTAVDVLNVALKHLNDKGEHLLLKFWQTAVHVLGSEAQPLHKEAYLFCLFKLKYRVLKSREAKAAVEALLLRTALPLAWDKHRLVRLRALDVIAMYGDLPLSSGALGPILALVFELFNGEAFLESYKSGLALACLLNNQEAKETIRPHIGQVLDIYLRLAAASESEALLRCLQRLVCEFEDQVQPFADRLFLALANLLTITSQQLADQDEEEPDYSHLQACIRALKSILQVEIAQGTLATQVGPVLVDRFIHVASRHSRCIDDLLQLVHALLVRLQECPPCLLPLFQMVCGLNTLVFETGPAVDPQRLALVRAVHCDLQVDVVGIQYAVLCEFGAKLGDQLKSRDCLGRTYLQTLWLVIGATQAEALQRKDGLAQIKIAVLLITLTERVPTHEVLSAVNSYLATRLNSGAGEHILCLLHYLAVLLNQKGVQCCLPMESALRLLEGTLAHLPANLAVTPLAALIPALSPRGAACLVRKLLSREEQEEEQEENTLALLAKYAHEQDNDDDDYTAEIEDCYRSVHDPSAEPRQLHEAISRQTETYRAEVAGFLTQKQLQEFAMLAR